MSLIYISLADRSVRKRININDANKLTKAGCYYSDGTVINNLPEISDNTKYSITVLPMDDNGSYTHILTDNLGNMYIRNCIRGTWRNWGKVNGAGSGSTEIADMAEKLSTARTISLTGDATGSTIFDGSVNVTIPVDLTASGVTAAAYGPSANVTGTNATTITVPRITVAADGRITSARNYTLTNSDCKVTQSVSSSSSGIPVLLAYAATPSSGTISSVLYSNSVKIVPSTGTLIATNITATKYTSTAAINTRLAVADNNSTTTGNYSAGIGENVKVSGFASLAVGNGVTAAGYNQVVIGKNNEADTTSNVALIIGNGTSSDNKHNMVEAYYDGTITVTGKNLDSHFGSLIHYMNYKSSKDDVHYTVPGLYFGTISPDGTTVTEDTSVKATGIRTTTLTVTGTSYFGNISFNDTVTYPQVAGDGTRLVLGYNNSTTGNLVVEATAIRSSGNATQTLGTSAYRWSTIYSSSGTIVTSDEEKKKDINPIDTEVAIALIKGLDPITYKLIDGTSDRTHWGLGARSVEDTLASLELTSKDFAGLVKSPKVTTDKETMESVVNESEFDYALRYDEFIAPTLTVIQHLLDTIESQNKTIVKLNTKLDNLEKDIIEVKGLINSVSKNR